MHWVLQAIAICCMPCCLRTWRRLAAPELGQLPAIPGHRLPTNHFRRLVLEQRRCTVAVGPRRTSGSIPKAPPHSGAPCPRSARRHAGPRRMRAPRRARTPAPAVQPPPGGLCGGGGGRKAAKMGREKRQQQMGSQKAAAKHYGTRDSRVITQPSTSLAQTSLTCEF